jgi:hypothetical protein
MRKTRYSEEQVIRVPQKVESGSTVKDVGSPVWSVSGMSGPIVVEMK